MCIFSCYASGSTLLYIRAADSVIRERKPTHHPHLSTRLLIYTLKAAHRSMDDERPFLYFFDIILGKQ